MVCKAAAVFLPSLVITPLLGCTVLVTNARVLSTSCTCPLCRCCLLVVVAVTDSGRNSFNVLLVCKAAAAFVLNSLTLPVFNFAYLNPEFHPDWRCHSPAPLPRRSHAGWHRSVVPHRLVLPLRCFLSAGANSSLQCPSLSPTAVSLLRVPGSGCLVCSTRQRSLSGPLFLPAAIAEHVLIEVLAPLRLMWQRYL